MKSALQKRLSLVGGGVILACQDICSKMELALLEQQRITHISLNHPFPNISPGMDMLPQGFKVLHHQYLLFSSSLQRTCIANFMNRHLLAVVVSLAISNSTHRPFISNARLHDPKSRWVPLQPISHISQTPIDLGLSWYCRNIKPVDDIPSYHPI